MPRVCTLPHRLCDFGFARSLDDDDDEEEEQWLTPHPSNQAGPADGIAGGVPALNAQNPSTLVTGAGGVPGANAPLGNPPGGGGPYGGPQPGQAAYATTRYYRAPEVLVGAQYGTGVDVWALGGWRIHAHASLLAVECANSSSS